MSEVQTHSTYHLPSGYDDNRIVLLARDPHQLYAYWEISNTKKNTFFGEFGYELWERSVPVLKVTNVSKNSSFYIRVNDFSNNWYVHVTDPNCLYVAEIGRRVSEEFFINLASSNYIVTPAENISQNTASYFINYRDLRCGRLDPDTGKIYETYDFKLHARGVLGLSSPELYGINLEESGFGLSSAELFGISISEHLGISSQSFIR